MNISSAFQEKKFQFQPDYNSRVFQDTYKIDCIVEIINRYISRERQSSDSLTITDLGCYDGHILKQIRTKVKKPAKLVLNGVDISVDAMKGCADSNIHTFVADFESNNEALCNQLGSSSDIVICADVIEHLFNSHKILELSNKILRKEGLLIVTTPNIASLGRRIQLLLGINPYFEHSPIDPSAVGHIRFFTFDSLRKLMQSFPFTIIDETSEYVTLGSVRSSFLAKLASSIPTIGKSIFIVAKKK